MKKSQKKEWWIDIYPYIFTAASAEEAAEQAFGGPVTWISPFTYENESGYRVQVTEYRP